MVRSIANVIYQTSAAKHTSTVFTEIQLVVDISKNQLSLSTSNKLICLLENVTFCAFKSNNQGKILGSSIEKYKKKYGQGEINNKSSWKKKWGKKLSKGRSKQAIAAGKHSAAKFVFSWDMFHDVSQRGGELRPGSGEWMDYHENQTIWRRVL